MGDAKAGRHEEMREQILHGPITPALLKLAWPTALTAALQGLMAAVDVLMVGRLGQTALASVAAGRQAVMVLMIAGMAVAVGGGTLVAQAVGRGDRDLANHVLTQALLSFVLALVLVMVPVGWFITPPVMRWLVEGDAAVVALAVPYMRVVICSSVFTLVGFCASAGLRGAGDTRTPLRIALWANLLNVPLNWIFIFGVPALGLPAMGVAGAAWGTAVARAATNLVLLWWLWRGRLAIRFTPLRTVRLDGAVLLDMARIGVPASLSGIILNVNGMALIAVLARTEVGQAAVAGYSLAMTFRNFGTWVTWGLSDATMAAVGQNLGAGQRRRARAAGFAAARVSALFLGVAGVLLVVVAPLCFPAILHEDDPVRKQTVLFLARQFLVSQMFALPFLGVGMACEGALRGAGDSFTAMVNNAVSFLIVGVPLCAVLGLDRIALGPVTLPGLALGPLGVWIGLAAAMVVRGVTMLARWRRTRWTRVR